MNPIVAGWVALSILGLLVSSYLVRETLLDLRDIRGLVNGRRIAAWSRLAREGLRATVHLVYLLIGLPLLGSEVHASFLVFGLMWGNVAMVANSVIDARSRHLLVATRDSEPSLTRE